MDMTKVLIAVALTGTALVAAQDAQARSRYNPQRCVPTVSGSGRTILVCGGQGGVYNPVTCRKVYNVYTRRFEVIC